MKTTYQALYDIIDTQRQGTAKEFREMLGVSQVLIHRHLKRLCQEGRIEKRGVPPKVFYIKKTHNPKVSDSEVGTSALIEKNWLEIIPDGTFVYGNKGFFLWCHERGLDRGAKAKEYEFLFEQKEKLKVSGLIDATEKLTQSFSSVYLEKIWYIDFYSWEIFGKTLLGKLILYAKQNSDLVLMKYIAERIKNPLESFINQEGFDAIIPIPHSIVRKKDFLRTTLGFLNINPKPQKVFEKIFIDHVVAQKTLKSKVERERNAQETLFLRKKDFPSKVLLIDDACGSGATLNIAAQKIIEISPKTKVFGLAFVGSMKGFEVIAES